MSDFVETCRIEEVPCGNEHCQFYDEKAEQYCNGERDGWPAVAECLKYTPKMRNVECAHCGYQTKIDVGVINHMCSICAGITVMD